MSSSLPLALPAAPLRLALPPAHDSGGTAAVRQVVKRDGTRMPWDPAKVTRAVALAFHDVLTNGAPNPHRGDAPARWGVDLSTFLKALAITGRVERMLELVYRHDREPTIEQIQDTDEKAIAAEGEWEVARSYIVYRERQAAARLAHHPDKDRKSTRLNSSHVSESRMPSSA